MELMFILMNLISLEYIHLFHLNLLRILKYYHKKNNLYTYCKANLNKYCSLYYLYLYLSILALFIRTFRNTINFI
jgi:hypothetical protein